jgi:hypothetical protein
VSAVDESRPAEGYDLLAEVLAEQSVVGAQGAENSRENLLDDDSPFTALCRAILETVVDAPDWIRAPVSHEEMLARFALLDDALDALKQAYGAAQEWVVNQVDDEEPVPGGGFVKLGGGGSKKVTDVERLKSVVIERCSELVGMEGDPRIAIVVDRVWQLAPTTPSAGFRVEGAKALSIVLNGYQERDRSRRTVRIVERRREDGSLVPRVVDPEPF